MQDSPPHEDSWRRAGKVAALWVVVLGPAGSAVAFFTARHGAYPAGYFVWCALLVVALAMPLSAGQWHGSWKVAWLTLAFEVACAGAAVLGLLGWASFQVASPR